MTDWSRVRSDFPALRGRVYLNTAGGGPLCPEAAQAVRAYYEELHQDGDLHWDACLAGVEDVRERLARLLRASPKEVAFLGNASHGLNLAADLLEGDGEVLALDGDFPSVTLPWLARGRDVRFVGSPEDIPDAIRPETAVVAVSSVLYKTGIRLDLEHLGAICHERNVRLVADATQGFGVFGIDLGRASVDVLVFSGYKWATAGYGIAPLVVRRELLRDRGLPAAGWRSARDPYALEARRLDPTDEARGLELGHPPFAGVFALGGALTRIERLGLDAITERVQELVETLHAGLDRQGVPLTSPREPEERSGITMIRIPHPAEVAKALAAKNILVSARGDGLRVSLHYYNDEADIEAFLDALVTS